MVCTATTRLHPPLGNPPKRSYELVSIFSFKCGCFSAGRHEEHTYLGYINGGDSLQVLSENMQLPLLKLLMTSQVNQKGLLGSSYEGHGTG